MSSARRLFIRQAFLADPETPAGREGDLAVEDGRLVSPAAGARPGDLVIEGRGLVALPGLVDLHVHLRDPGQTHKETLETAAAAALAGGVLWLAAMPNTAPPADTPERVAALAARSPDWPRLLPVGAMTRERAGRECAPLAELARAGAAAFSDDGDTVADAGVMRRVLEQAAAAGRPALCHCEDPALVAGGAANEGPVARALGVGGRPAEAEEAIVARDLALARLTGARVHVCHVSCARAVELVRRARAEGLPVSAEATPHHLCFDEEAARGGDTAFKMNPPLRTAADRRALVEGLLDGTISAIASDHAPHTPTEKAAGFAAAPAGVVGLETMLGAVATHLVRPGIINWADAARLLARNPAAILGLAEAGRLAAGAPAALLLLDPEASAIVDPATFRSLGRSSPFTGQRLFGRIEWLIAGGEVRRPGRSAGS